jgi:hypothetical protein
MEEACKLARMPCDPAYDIIRPGVASGKGVGMDYPW